MFIARWLFVFLLLLSCVGCRLLCVVVSYMIAGVDVRCWMLLFVVCCCLRGCCVVIVVVCCSLLMFDACCFVVLLLDVCSFLSACRCLWFVVICCVLIVAC